MWPEEGWGAASAPSRAGGERAGLPVAVPARLLSFSPLPSGRVRSRAVAFSQQRQVHGSGRQNKQL